jgi:hypothetical protein
MSSRTGAPRNVKRSYQVNRCKRRSVPSQSGANRDGEFSQSVMRVSYNLRYVPPRPARVVLIRV